MGAICLNVFAKAFASYQQCNCYYVIISTITDSHLLYTSIWRYFSYSWIKRSFFAILLMRKLSHGDNNPIV